MTAYVASKLLLIIFNQTYGLFKAWLKQTRKSAFLFKANNTHEIMLQKL